LDPAEGRGDAGLRDAYKTASLLKARKVLFPIRNGLYFVTAGRAVAAMEEISIVEDAYWKIVRKVLAEKAGEGVIAGPKALEIRLRDLSIPDTLIVYTKETNAIVRISDRHTLVLKTAKTGEKSGRKNAYVVFRKMSEAVLVDGVRLRVAGIEHAFLDALTTHKGLSPDDAEHSVRKAVAKFAKAVDRERLGALVACKYLRAVNRLRAIAKESGQAALYEKALDVVKIEGGNCFVSY
jgi:hypothetical protein